MMRCYICFIKIIEKPVEENIIYVDFLAGAEYHVISHRTTSRTTLRTVRDRYYGMVANQVDPGSDT